jgi:hypothetical protein
MSESDQEEYFSDVDDEELLEEINEDTKQEKLIAEPNKKLTHFLPL